MAECPELSAYENPYAKDENQWFSKHDEYRLQLYKWNRSLYMGDHYNAFRFASYLYRSGMLDDDTRLGEIFGKGGSDVLFLACNLFSLCTDTFADLVAEALGPLTSEDRNQEIRGLIRRIEKDSGFKALLHRSVTTGSYKGDIVWSVHAEKAVGTKPPRVYIRGRRVDNWFPVIDPSDATRFSEHHFIYRVKIGEKTYAAREMHKADGIYLDVREVDGTKFKGPAPASVYKAVWGERPPFYPTTEARVFHLPNKVGDDNDPYGDTDYGRGVVSLADELNHRLTQEAYELDKHARLGATGPWLDEEETANPSGDNPTNRGLSGKYIPREADDPEPKYIAYPSDHLTVVDKRIEGLMEEIPRQMRMSPRLLGYKAGAAEEAFDTLRLACVQTLLRNKARILYLDAGIKGAFATALTLAKEVGLEPLALEGQIKVGWGDGFPMDEEKAARIHQIRTNNLATESQRAAIEDLEGPDGAEEMIDEIKAEQESSLKQITGQGQAKPAFNFKGLGPEESPPAEPPEINAGQEEPGARAQGR
ncbi:MAG: hypothetical protein ABT940_12430 [Alphaproteobacteria bacterium]